ncbi:MAG: nucleotidyl transferase AbiEii/AbiGii toxin family protein [Acidobacteriota bacterium]|nr:nucleotidyl transferase AbiEii/AbiGii toxin family protein [Acidobacteriota bacterium]
MKEEAVYKKQVALLLRVLPEVAGEKRFALHGGTAINLFVRDLPRLSVDIDLTYVPVEDRDASLANIGSALEGIRARIERVIPEVRVEDHRDKGKLLISQAGADVKLEVNLVKRGTLQEPVEMPLCGRAQEAFDAFCVIPVVPFGQLYGGKICAALDRQHPRDLFDVKYLLENEGFSEPVKTGFLLCLAGSDRPLHEVIDPNLLDQRAALENQFSGMSEEIFSYAEYERVREKLIETIHWSLTAEDKRFLLSVKALQPDWSVYDFARFPAVNWKLRNLKKLKESNPDKYHRQYESLEKTLNSF